MIKLVTFLGNPGRQYEFTRHNVAWFIADELSKNFALNWQTKFKGLYCQQRVGGQAVYFLKPETFMNKSGESVVALTQFFKIEPRQMLVVHDDIELDFGWCGIKKGGGLAGHNGLRSIAALLGTRDFFRLRIGVSRPVHGSVNSYVLSKFSRDELIMLPLLIEKTTRLLETCLSKDIETCLEKYSKYKLF